LALQRGNLAAVVLIALVALAVVGVFKWRPWDSRMSATDVERALPATARAEYPRLRSDIRFHCVRTENDGSSVMHDVDYECEPVGDRRAPGFWVGTNRHRITEVEPIE
jgi:hypothetical protein